jgi:hypothetical protein
LLVSARWTLLAAIWVLACGAANAAAVVPPAAGKLVEFEYHVSNANPALISPGITYTNGTLAEAGGSVTVQYSVRRRGLRHRSASR